MIYKISHAGCAGHGPANTLSSIKKALELEVDMIEIDVHRCQSGEVVLIHDETVSKTTNGRGKVKDIGLKRLKELRIENIETIPTLQEALNVIDKKTEINIELKSVDSAKATAMVIDEYINEHGWDIDTFLISSFKIKALEIFRAIHPTIKIGVLTELPTSKTLRVAKKLHAYSINAEHYFISESFITVAHREGFKVFAFTANESEDIENLKHIGVDGIFSDYPERL